MNPSDEELLSAYLDGELTADEQARVERWLAEDSGYRQLHEELRALRQHIETLPMARLPADFRETVLSAAERQMVAPKRSTAAMQPAPLPDGRRWVRPLMWTGLIAAAALLVMIFSPPGTEQQGPNVAKTDAPQAAKEAKVADSKSGELSIQAAPEPAAVAAPEAESGALEEANKNQLAGKALPRKRAESGAFGAAKDETAQAESRRDGKADGYAQSELKGKLAQDEDDRVQGNRPKAGGAYRASQALKIEADRNGAKMPMAPTADAPLPKPAAAAPPAAGVPTDALQAKQSPQLAPAAEPAVAQQRAGEKTPEAADGAPGEGLPDALGTTGPEGRGGVSGRATFSAPAEAAADIVDKSQQEAQPGKSAPSPMVIAIRLSGQEGDLARFEKLLSQAQQGAAQQQQGQDLARLDAGNARSQDEEPRSALREQQAGQGSAPATGREIAKAQSGGRSETRHVPAAVHVYDAEISHDALIGLLTQLRGSPGSYQFESLPGEFAQDAKRRAVELADDAIEERLNNSLDESEDLKEKKEVPQTERAAQKGSPAPAADAAAQIAAAPAPRMYRVRIVLRQGLPAANPAAARAAETQIQEK